MKKKKINVVSLFDGGSCAQVALKDLGYELNYYASEIDQYAIKVTQKNHPHTVQLGDVKNISWKKYKEKRFFDTKGTCPKIDLLIGGSPCQDLSIAKKNRQGLSGKRSGLFYEYLRLLKEIKPRYFILENVNSMPAEARDEISKELGVEPIMINAALVSAQQRKRLFWTNIPNVDLPKDRNIFLKDILESGVTDRLKSFAIDANYYKGATWENYKNKKQRQLVIEGTLRIGQIGKGGQGDRIYSIDGKSVALSANGGGRGAKTGLYLIQVPRGKNKGGKKALDGKTPTLSCSAWPHNNKLFDNGVVRKLTPVECERLQCLPDNYTEGISDTQRYKVCGNAFNVEVVKHILSKVDF